MAYHAWLIEVLDDLIDYAKNKELQESARDLSTAKRTVEREIRITAGAHIAGVHSDARMLTKQR